LLSEVSRYLFNQIQRGQKIQESEFHFIFVSSVIKSFVPTATQSLHPQALRVFEIEKSSIHSSSG